MENQSREKKRAANIIWNASDDYSFQPDFEIYDGKGEAELYWNYIIGAVRKYYDYSQLQCFFNRLKVDPNHVFYESLLWIGLENATFEKGKKDRPVLESLRRSYAIKVLLQQDAASFYYLVDEIKKAHFQKALGEEPVMREQVAKIINDLEFSESMNTEQIICRMNEIINDHFPLSGVRNKRKLFGNLSTRKKRLRFGEGGSPHLRTPFLDAAFPNPFDMGSSELSNEGNYLEKKEKYTPKKLWRDLNDRLEKRQRAIIQNEYGASILPEAQIKALERILCVENHKTCHLHFTRGEYNANVVRKAGSNDLQKAALNQREKNKANYQENIARNSNSIEKLTSIIRNTMLVHCEVSCHRAKGGMLVAGKVWRNVYLDDEKVFLKNVIDEVGNLSVDIMLDASGSQINRQEIIATEGFIIAESLTRCQIPVRVFAFCTNKNFTVINLFRDYGEVDKNAMVFHYHSSGCNRDGLAMRTALHLMDGSQAEHKVLIVLSDGKPLDPYGIPGSQFNPDQYIYTDAAGVSDTAMEVRTGWRKGISILCVFTGAEADLPAAKKMYGNNLVTIKSPENFAEIVGVLLRNIMKNL